MSRRRTFTASGGSRVRAGALVLALLATLCVMPHDATAADGVTIDSQAWEQSLGAGLPSGRGLAARAVWDRDDGAVARAEALDENKLGLHGGLVLLGWTQPLHPRALVSLQGSAGHGGPHWALQRVDADLTLKWGADAALLTRAGLGLARYDGGRRDETLRLALAWYAPASWVLETGLAVNRSQPGAVVSRMPFVAATWGQDGRQYLSLRASSGREAWQTLGSGATLVDFHSRSVGATARWWLQREGATRWGLDLQAEHYRNPGYARRTLGAGLFVQF